MLSGTPCLTLRQRVLRYLLEMRVSLLVDFACVAIDNITKSLIQSPLVKLRSLPNC